MSGDLRMSEALEDLLNTVLEHAVNSVAEGDVLVPIVAWEKGKSRQMQRFLVETDDPDQWDAGASVEQAIAFARGLKGKADRVVIATDGRISDAPDGEKTDCLFIDAFEPALRALVRVGQCYTPAGDDGEFGLIDDPGVLAVMDPLW